MLKIINLVKLIYMQKITTFIKNSLEKKVSLIHWITIFLMIIFFRIFIEFFLAYSTHLFLKSLIVEYLHNLFFFSLSYLLIWFFLSFLLKVNLTKLAYIFLWATLLIIFPPILDMLKTQGQVFWSFYLLSSPSLLFSQFMTYFGNLPSGIVYFGTKIVFSFTIFLSASLIFLKTKDTLKTLFGIIGIYLILFFMGAFPTFFVIFYDLFTAPQKITHIQGYTIAQFFSAHAGILGLKYQGIAYSLASSLDLIYFLLLTLLLSIFFFSSHKKQFLALIRNYRYSQIIYLSGLFFIGIGLGALAYPQNFNLNLFSVLALLVALVSIWLAWKTSVIINDIYDLSIDKISNSHRPLPQNIFSRQEYISLGIVFFLLSLIGAFTLNLTFVALILTFQFLAWFYSAPPLRLKKIPLIATLVSAWASITILFLGFILLSSNQTLQNLSWRIPLLLILTYTLSLPIKDFKDIQGDKKYAIWTIPVIFGERKARLIIAINLFISFMLSVFFLNELRLFFWALLLGIITFLVIINEKINPRHLPAWVLTLVFVYGLILVRIVFLPN